MTTPEWKRLVRNRIEANARENREPRSIKELARKLKADPAGLYRMLDGPQRTSKYAPEICALLGIQPGMVANPAVTDAVGDDDFEREVARLRSLSPARKRRALAIVKTYLDGLDEE